MPRVLESYIEVFTSNVASVKLIPPHNGFIWINLANGSIHLSLKLLIASKIPIAPKITKPKYMQPHVVLNLNYPKERNHTLLVSLIM